MRSSMKLIILFLILLSALYSRNITNITSLIKTVTISDEAILDANNISCIFYNNGIWGYNLTEGNWGLEWPKRSGLSPLFAGGIMIGAKVNDEVRVAAIQHDATEFQPGSLNDDGSPTDPADPVYRWYELKPGGAGDWSNWPTEQGAPLDQEGNPKLTGDQTIFSIFNDQKKHEYYGSNPLGAEIHQTAWATEKVWPYRDMIFIKWKIINKSPNDWDSTYLSIWTDPDVGDAGDDLVGCDSTLNLAYAYNGHETDQKYGKIPPAVGTKILQGALVDANGGQVVLPDGRRFDNVSEQKMRSFLFYVSGSGNAGSPETPEDIYYYMQAKWQDGSPLVNDGQYGTSTGPRTTYMFTGDPESGEGWLDKSPADRRMLMSVGPFDMPVWSDANNNNIPDLGEPGVQEIVAAVIVARGTSHLNSVTKLKNLSKYADRFYQKNFILENNYTVEKPVVMYSELSSEIILSWKNNAEYDDNNSPLEITVPFLAENFGNKITKGYDEFIVDDSTYNFYGYSIYQYSDSEGNDPVLVDQWNDESYNYEKKRYIKITHNYHPLCGKVDYPLANGRSYYFGVVAEAKNIFATPEILTSKPTIITVTPQHFPGREYDSNFAFGDTLKATYGQMDNSYPAPYGKAIALVVDPSKTTGHDYKISFNENSTWNLIDLDENEVLLENQTNKTFDDDYDIIDGLQVKVGSAERGIRAVEELDQKGTVLDDAVSIVSPSLGTTGYIVTNRSGKYNQPPYTLDFDRFNYWDDSDLVIDFADSSLTWNYNSEEINFVDGQPYYAPFAIYQITYPEENPTRLFPVFLDSDESGTWNIAYDLDSNAIWQGPIYEAAAYEPLSAYVGYDENGHKVSYDPTQENQYIADNSLYTSANTSWSKSTGEFKYPYLTATLFSMYLEDATLPFGNKVRFRTHKLFSENDYFTFTAPAAPTDSLKDQKADIDLIKVVPNPYYGYKDLETNNFARNVQFTNLPDKCDIMVFDLAGNKVWEYHKNNQQTLLKWDLNNLSGWPVASGVYIYVVSIEKLGEKVGKLAVFRRE